MTHDHDDGLVHSHGWACRERGAPRGATVHRPMGRELRPMQPEDGHDEGLVHGHGWACGERGRMG